MDERRGAWRNAGRVPAVAAYSQCPTFEPQSAAVHDNLRPCSGPGQRAHRIRRNGDRVCILLLQQQLQDQSHRVRHLDAVAGSSSRKCALAAERRRDGAQQLATGSSESRGRSAEARVCTAPAVCRAFGQAVRERQSQTRRSSLCSTPIAFGAIWNRPMNRCGSVMSAAIARRVSRCRPRGNAQMVQQGGR